MLTFFFSLELQDSIDEFAKSYGIGKPFIGLILIPIVGNAAEVGLESNLYSFQSFTTERF